MTSEDSSHPPGPQTVEDGSDPRVPDRAEGTQPLAAWVDARARALGLEVFDARVLAAHALGVPRTRLITADGPPPEPQRRRVEALLARRAAGEPVAYLVGSREFFGRPFAVRPGVLIPRPETELLVECAIEAARAKGGQGEAAALEAAALGAAALEAASPAPQDGAGLRLLDLGTGSGAIAITLALELPGAEVVATDRSEAALEVTRANAQALGARRVRLAAGSWWEALAAGERFDLVVSNPPYIAADDEHLRQGDLRFEPPGALTDGADGLEAIRAIVAGARGRLTPGGHLLIEHGWRQARQVRELLQAAGLRQARSWRDLAGIERVSGAIAPAAPSIPLPRARASPDPVR